MIKPNDNNNTDKADAPKPIRKLKVTPISASKRNQLKIKRLEGGEESPVKEGVA